MHIVPTTRQIVESVERLEYHCVTFLLISGPVALCSRELATDEGEWYVILLVHGYFKLLGWDLCCNC